MDRIITTQSDGHWYEIRVQGRLDRRWAAWLDDMALTPGDGETTLLRGPLADQPALHGLLARLRDLGVLLISVNQVEPGGGPTSPAPTSPAEQA